nr:hypothetical protein [uncultured Caproiciproducens sp.]
MKIVVKGGFRQLRMKRGFSIKTFAKAAGIAYRTAFRSRLQKMFLTKQRLKLQR